MASLLIFSIPFALNQMLSQGAETQQCPAFGSEQSIYGWMLQRHIYNTMMADLGLDCLLVCRKDDRCQSFNFVMSLHMCEFSDRTKEARPKDFIPDPDRYYFRRDIKRVPLGSIPELAAASCKEIKASEEKDISAKYWLSTIKPNVAVLAYCDMKTEDVDECTASPPVCDMNAICNNTIGSYNCNCKPGYSGNGRICVDIDECSSSPSVCDANANCNNTAGSYSCTCTTGFGGDGKICRPESCNAILKTDSSASDGIYTITTPSWSSQVFCDVTSTGQGWTLVARFSNNDTKNWMNDSGAWWYDRTVGLGNIYPSANADMISPAFWLVSGHEFKITRSDDPQHTPLLQTRYNCLGGLTFRSKIISYGNFRNGIVWASNRCRGSCYVQYSGQYKTTQGFQWATCNGNMQSNNRIGFWCDWSTGDGAVMMIGGGGSNCSRADHGIGITEANAASFDDAGTDEEDFGDVIFSLSTTLYSLNLWIK